jgi:hypothetical protein
MRHRSMPRINLTLYKHRIDYTIYGADGVPYIGGPMGSFDKQTRSLCTLITGTLVRIDEASLYLVRYTDAANERRLCQ